ncbi:hypothetical protein F5888DRAFT_1121337 [Russula emetica]|nr:hypothetical protein F5888DRAFT_1121337 [Russula emetica]
MKRSYLRNHPISPVPPAQSPHVHCLWPLLSFPVPKSHRSNPHLPFLCTHLPSCLQVFSCGEDKPQYTRLKDSSSQNPVGNPYHDTSTLSDKLRSALKTQLLTSTTPIPTLTTATSTTGATHPSTATASQPTTQPTTTMTTSSPQVQSDTSPPSSHDSKRYDYTSERKKFDKRARGVYSFATDDSGGDRLKA